jgi:hypothetical protein
MWEEEIKKNKNISFLLFLVPPVLEEEEKKEKRSNTQIWGETRKIKMLNELLVCGQKGGGKKKTIRNKIKRR